MGSRQREKSGMTKAELVGAMERLFLEKGYQETTVKDITEAAGYAVGSFYRHWKSKEQAFLEYCEEYVAGFIQTSVENAPHTGTAEQMLEYLLSRSEEFANSQKTIRLYAVSRLLSATHQGGSQVENGAQRYTEMLVEFLRRCTGCQQESRLRQVASMLHTLLDTHALRNTPLVYPPFVAEDATLKACLLAMIGTLA